MKETIIVKGMTCQHCEKSVHDTLTHLDGVESVNIDLDTGEVDVLYDDSVINLATLEEAIEDQGYEVEK